MDKTDLRKQAGLAVAVSVALTAFVPTLAGAANTTVVNAGDFVKLFDDPNGGNTNGGAFQVDVQGKGTANDFRTFCLEYNETFSYGQPLKVGAVSNVAQNGGISGGNPDPLDVRTAWLYWQFDQGTLTGWTHNNASGNSLQRAIWFIEGELGASYTMAQLTTLDSQAATWVTLAGINATWNVNTNRVHVLNLLKQNNQGQYVVNSQDQLYITPVPEPETYAMLLAGLGLMGFVARRRKASARLG